MILLYNSLIQNYLENIAKSIGLPESYHAFFVNIILIIAIIIVSLLSYYLARFILIRVVKAVSLKTKNKWDDALVERHFFRKLAFIVPAILLMYFNSILFKRFPFWEMLFSNILSIYVLIMTMITINALINTINDIYQTFSISRTKSIKGYLQIVKILIFTLGGIIILSIILRKDAAVIIGGFGAATAVLLLVFRDPILGLVGSIQLSANDMVRPNDWIVMESHGADGTVIDMNLTTVKVQNWDKTITTIPTYALVSESFRNWRGMEESGGRRIVRAINIDAKSIKLCDDEMLERFEKINLISDYVKKKREELDGINQRLEEGVPNIDINLRKQTNIGVFRQYLLEYINSNPHINKSMTIIVRQLEPGPLGVPVQIYCFSRIQAWVEYEKIQSDIFDHVLSVIDYFDLKVFQQPTGEDMRFFFNANAKPEKLN